MIQPGTYTQNPYQSHYGQGSLLIADELIGRILDDDCMAVLWSYDPYCIRVSTGSLTCDGHSNRITVIVSQLGRVEGVWWEHNIYLPDDVKGGSGSLRHRMKNNPQLLDQIDLDKADRYRRV